MFFECENTAYLDALFMINSKKFLGGRVFEAFLSILLIKDQQKRRSILSSFLTGMFCNGTTAHEVACMINAIIKYEGRNFCLEKIKLKKKVISILGSGKKGFKTFNISTGASLVSSCCGATVAKIGSSATSSLMGSKDILSYLGANLNLTLSQMISIIYDLDFGFFSIEESIPIFDEIYGGYFYSPNVLSYYGSYLSNRPLYCGISRKTFCRLGRLMTH